jgi:hypothetical protein
MKTPGKYVDEFDDETAQLTTGALNILERHFAAAMADARRAALEEALRATTPCGEYGCPCCENDQRELRALLDSARAT